MLTSDKVFSCQICAAQPVNQFLQGCFEPAPRPNVILENVFERCPITYQCRSAQILVRAYQDGLLDASYETKQSTPTKRLVAVHYIDFLKKLREAHDY